MLCPLQFSIASSSFTHDRDKVQIKKELRKTHLLRAGPQMVRYISPTQQQSTQHRRSLYQPICYYMRASVGRMVSLNHIASACNRPCSTASQTVALWKRRKKTSTLYHLLLDQETICSLYHQSDVSDKQWITRAQQFWRTPSPDQSQLWKAAT